MTRLEHETLAEIVLNQVDESNVEEFKKAYDEVTAILEKRFNKLRRERRKRRLLFPSEP